MCNHQRYSLSEVHTTSLISSARCIPVVMDECILFNPSHLRRTHVRSHWRGAEECLGEPVTIPFLQQEPIVSSSHVQCPLFVRAVKTQIKHWRTLPPDLQKWLDSLLTGYAASRRSNQRCTSMWQMLLCWPCCPPHFTSLLV
ncbi:hypothetical protein MRB53_039017 [Persea americana]|nr:hypothetical protein MRB53_039017 [Persea americana]